MSDSVTDVLLADADPDFLKTLETWVQAEGWSYQSFSEGHRVAQVLNEKKFRAALIDLNLPGLSGLQLLEWSRTQPTHPEIIITTKTSSIQEAIHSLKMGAFDVLTKPMETPLKMVFSVRQALDRAQLFEGSRDFSEENSFMGIVGQGNRMKGIFEMIRQVAPSACNVLIQGESGTGKELVAQAIHKLGVRKDKPFVVINCAAMPDTLLESELFGYVKGAFTGAGQDKLGLFEVANGGTVFLDEIGEVPLPIQVKLLRVLQGGEILPLGSNQSRYVDVRLIAATNRVLVNRVQEGAFREDLYYRLNVVGINLPPLRQRVEDISSLAYHFLKKLGGRLGKKVEKIALDVMQAFEQYAWPGNIRELENVIERALVLCSGDTIVARNLPPKILSSTFYVPTNDDGDLSIYDYKEAKKRALNLFNRSYIMGLLEKVGGNITAASEKAGMDRSNFKKVLKKYGISAKKN